MHVEFHPAAIEEVHRARIWYRDRNSDVARAFMDEFDRAITLIQEAPTRWPMSGSARKFVLRRFPFVVFYRVREEIVQVVAVAHGRRRPGYWRRR